MASIMTRDQWYQVVIDWHQPLMAALEATGIPSFVETELGGGCFALSIPLETRHNPEIDRDESVRYAMITLDGPAWLVGYYNDLAAGWPAEYDSEGQVYHTLPCEAAGEIGPGDDPIPPGEAARVAAWIAPFVAEWRAA